MREQNSNFSHEVQNKFHPSNILLFGLFTDKRNANEKDLLTGSLDPMNLLRNVQINEKLENGKFANVAVLFQMVQFLFDVPCVIAYQRQILAATIHPIYSCVGTYAQLLNKIYFSSYQHSNEIISRTSIYNNILYKLGNSIKDLLNNLLSLKLFSECVQLHLEGTLMQLTKIFGSLHAGIIPKLLWTEQLYRRCAKSMTINLLKFDNIVNNPKTYSKNECDNIIVLLKNKIEDANSFVNVLNLYKEDYHNIIYPMQIYNNTIFKNNIKRNIVKENSRSYHLKTNYS
ncbi:uncharacterized protein LOC126905166 [Daktulosphaira vitifoliae]|uniref:uncharacterized protein LOC126905166 n=1 Tax=Daktulosphaira vitifoliae TaxID=58002 RepID=UPI0021AA60BC|nr:uncharacterized protein LOC126905166 [Daktulosphaira vitifoliae]